MRRHVLRSAAATAALLPALLLGTSLVVPASASEVESSAEARAGTEANPRDARDAAARSRGIRAATLTPVAQSWPSGTIPVGGSEYWSWSHAPVNAVLAVAIAPHDLTQHNTCSLRVARTWYVKTSSGERQFRFQITNPADQLQSCQGKILLDWKSAGTTWSSGTLSSGATGSWTWKHANPAKVYVVGVNPAKTGTGKCAIEITSTAYVRQASGEVQYTFALKNIGSLPCGSQIQLAWLDTTVLPVASVLNPQTLQPNGEGQVVWTKYPLSSDVVHVPGLSLTNTTSQPSSACQIALTSHDFYAFRLADGSAGGFLKAATKNTGSVACQPRLLMAKM
jgi:hypothetical protein